MLSDFFYTDHKYQVADWNDIVIELDLFYLDIILENRS